MYYLRTRPAVDAVQFTVDKLALRDQLILDKNIDKKSYTLKEKLCEQTPDQVECLICSS